MPMMMTISVLVLNVKIVQRKLDVNDLVVMMVMMMMMMVVRISDEE